MAWALVFWILAPQGAGPATLPGFSTIEACRAAGEAVEARFASDAYFRPRYVTWVCVEVR